MLHRACVGFDALDEVVHDATIERRDAATALMTARGYRDIIEMGTEQRYDIHDMFLHFPEPLVPRALRFEVKERLVWVGPVVRPLDLAQARAALAAV